MTAYLLQPNSLPPGDQTIAFLQWLARLATEIETRLPAYRTIMNAEIHSTLQTKVAAAWTLATRSPVSTWRARHCQVAAACQSVHKASHQAAARECWARLQIDILELEYCFAAVVRFGREAAVATQTLLWRSLRWMQRRAECEIRH